VHDFLTVGAAAPLQEAGAAAMALPPEYYAQLAHDYRERRDVLCDALEKVGFTLTRPDGAYYVMCDTAPFDAAVDDVAFARRLVEEVGVAAVPGSSFYRPEVLNGRSKIRFAFPKRLETLEAAAERLLSLRA
jgi:aspartate/methionine/tyrosine aminotransferase